MKIELVEVIERIFTSNDIEGIKFWAPAIVELLRAEAWHPIEKAEELGAKDGRWVIVMHERWSQASWIWAGWVDYDSRPINGITHFRFINPPEN
jgi:hypothetical protein